MITGNLGRRNLLKVKVVPPQASSMYPVDAIDLANAMRDGIASAEQLRLITHGAATRAEIRPKEK